MNQDRFPARSRVMKVLQGLNLPLDAKFWPAPLISGGSDLGSFGPQAWQNGLSGGESLAVLDSVTKVLNKHTLKAGFVYRREWSWYVDQCPVGLSLYGGRSGVPRNRLKGSGPA